MGGSKTKLASDALKAARFGVWLEPKATKNGDLSQQQTAMSKHMTRSLQVQATLPKLTLAYKKSYATASTVPRALSLFDFAGNAAQISKHNAKQMMRNKTEALMTNFQTGKVKARRAYLPHF